MVEINQKNGGVARKTPYPRLFAVAFVIIAIIFLLIFGYKMAANIRDKGYICIEGSYLQCMAIQNRDVAVCDNLVGEDIEGCKTGYYITLASFEQDEQLCENLDTKLIPICKFLVSQDINKCTEDAKEKCERMLNFDIAKGINLESASDENKELWDMQVIAIALKTRDFSLCKKVINAKKNFVDNLRCELLLKGRAGDFCKTKLNQFCSTEPERFKR